MNMDGKYVQMRTDKLSFTLASMFVVSQKEKKMLLTKLGVTEAEEVFDAVHWLVKSFDSEHGVSWEGYDATCHLLELFLGREIEDEFKNHVDATDNVWYFTEPEAGEQSVCDKFVNKMDEKKKILLEKY
jgi:Mn-dependent DtxR family transcriptional regulator